MLVLSVLVAPAPAQSPDAAPGDGGPGRILWSADHEEGSLADWTDPGCKWPGGGVFNTGGADVTAEAVRDVAHSGAWSARATITHARRAENGSRAVRLMRWTNKAWDDDGAYFPREAYYGVWMYFPHAYNPNKHPPWDPGDGGWWNVFQFKSQDASGESRPVWTLNVACDEGTGRMSFYLYSPVNRPASYKQRLPLPIPVRRWVHVETFYRSETGRKGCVTVWQDGRRILDAAGVVTSLGGKDGTDTHAIWGVGNYTDHIRGDPAGEGTATIYFDDAAVSTARLSAAKADRPDDRG